jgi:hypothetical protein
MRIILALLAAFILNNFFGTSFVIYSIAPLGWLLLGWISARGSEEVLYNELPTTNNEPVRS